MATAFIESFNGSLRDEPLNEEIFDTLDDACRKIALWRYDYDAFRPHFSLGKLAGSAPDAHHETNPRLPISNRQSLVMNEERWGQVTIQDSFEFRRELQRIRVNKVDLTSPVADHAENIPDICVNDGTWFRQAVCLRNDHHEPGEKSRA